MESKIEKRLIWLNGKLCPADEAKILVLSPTSQFGLNVFEGIPCFWNEKKQQLFAFRLDDHFKRLLNSAKSFPKLIPLSKKKICGFSRPTHGNQEFI